MPSDRIVERRRVFQQYKEDVKERGKPFFPYAMWHDTIMSLVVVVVIIGLAVVWKYSTPGDHHTHGAGLAREALRRPGRPGNDQLRPAPGLVLLLPLLPAADLQVAGVGAARHDRHPDDLRSCCCSRCRSSTCGPSGACSRRPVAIVASILVVLSMGVLTYKGATAKEALGSELAHVPTWAKKQGFQNNPAAIAGAKLFAVSGCLNCHVYLGDGGQNLGAPELTAEGAKNKGIAFQIAAPAVPGACKTRARRCRRSPASAYARSEAARDVPRSVQGPKVASSATARRAYSDQHDARARLRAHDVRPHRAGLRRDEPRHDRRPRRALAAARRARRRCAPATACSTRRAAPATSRSPT